MIGRLNPSIIDPLRFLWDANSSKRRLLHQAGVRVNQNVKRGLLGLVATATAVGAVAGGVGAAARRRRLQEYRRFRESVSLAYAIAVADYLASLRAASVPGVTPEMIRAIIDRRAPEIPIWYGDELCLLVTAVEPNDTPPTYGLECLRFTVSGKPEAAAEVLHALYDERVKELNPNPHPDADDLAMTELDDGRVTVSMVLSVVGSKDVYVPFAAGGLAAGKAAESSPQSP